jgi:ferredoxin
MRMTVPIVSFLNCLLLGAHFLRAGDAGAATGFALLGLAGFAHRAWLRWALAATMVFGSFVWAGALSDLVGFRLAAELPWRRTAIILGGVLALDLAGLALLLSPWAPRHYKSGKNEAAPRAAAFVTTCGLLLLTAVMSPTDVLLAERFFPGWGGLEIFGLGLYASWITGLMLDPSRSARIRGRIWGLFSLVFFAQAGLGLMGVPHLLMTGDPHLPVPALIAAGPVFRGGGYFMLILFTTSVLLAGPAWCSHLCYIGAWDHWASNSRRATPQLAPRAKHLRAVFLVLVLAAAFLMRALGVSTFAAVWSAAIFGLVGVAIMVVVSRRRGTMVHCTTYCPIGVVSNVLGKVNPWRVKIGEGCTLCGKCSRACRYSALAREDLERGRVGLSCTLCGDCVNACPEGRMHYAFPGLSPAAARAAFIALAVALHAVFLGVARI